MKKELEIWKFAAEKLERDESVMLLTSPKVWEVRPDDKALKWLSRAKNCVAVSVAA